jgi:hypothetical protein
VKRLAITILILFALVSPSRAQEVKEDKPVEAWIVYKQEGDKVIEVVKIKTASGKVYEIRPHLSKEEIPKPVNRLPEKGYSVLFVVTLALLLGILAGIGFVWWKMKKEGP